MMTGTITNFRPHISLFIRGEGGQGSGIFTVDTGFTGELTLPAAACHALQLPFIKDRRSQLANGTEVLLKVYRLTVTWDAIERLVEVLAIESEPLLGATMLEGYELCLNYSTNTVTIKAA